VKLRRFYLAVGIGIGYVLGTRAGRERYEELADALRRVADRPEVQSTAGMVAEQVSRASRQAMTALGGRVSEETRDKVSRAPFAVISRITPATAPTAPEGIGPEGMEGEVYTP
jgi:hypothetical protein